MFSGLLHLHIVVADVPRSVSFYHQAFGMEVLDFGKGDPDSQVFMSTPGVGEVFTISKGAPDKAGVNAGVDHFGFKVDYGQFEAALERVERAGGTLVERAELLPGVPTAFFHDPDGYMVQI